LAYDAIEQAADEASRRVVRTFEHEIRFFAGWPNR
jgi:hypothetical protein